jgi:prepilin peptidase CpaA
MMLDATRSVLLLAACVVLGAAAIQDIALRIIPNGLCASVAALGLMLRVLDRELLAALLAGTACLLLTMFFWLRGWLGGGDVKLLSAAALLVPGANLAGLLAGVALAGGVLAVIYLAVSLLVAPPRGSAPTSTLARIARVERWRASRRRSVPYACAIATGTVVMLLNG